MLRIVCRPYRLGGGRSGNSGLSTTELNIIAWNVTDLIKNVNPITTEHVAIGYEL